MTVFKEFAMNFDFIMNYFILILLLIEISISHTVIVFAIFFMISFFDVVDTNRHTGISCLYIICHAL